MPCEPHRSLWQKDRSVGPVVVDSFSVHFRLVTWSVMYLPSMRFPPHSSLRRESESGARAPFTPTAHRALHTGSFLLTLLGKQEERA